MNIEPTYVTFGQAKLLKEKGFDVECKALINSSYEPHHLKILEGQFLQKNSELLSNCYSAPEQWMVIEWLRVKHEIHITYNCDSNWKQKQYRHRAKFYYIIDFDHLDSMDEKLNPKFLFNSPQEAYSAAIDHVLTNLI